MPPLIRSPRVPNAARTRLRIGVPILGVVLTVAVIVVISLQMTGANRRGALELEHCRIDWNR